jgi:hypothetical protein
MTMEMNGKKKTEKKVHLILPNSPRRDPKWRLLVSPSYLSHGLADYVERNEPAPQVITDRNKTNQLVLGKENSNSLVEASDGDQKVKSRGTMWLINISHGALDLG